MTGSCLACRGPGDVARYRNIGYALVWLHPICAERWSAMGLRIELLTADNMRMLQSINREGVVGLRRRWGERRPETSLMDTAGG